MKRIAYAAPYNCRHSDVMRGFLFHVCRALVRRSLCFSVNLIKHNNYDINITLTSIYGAAITLHANQ